MNANGDQAKKIWATEVGFPSCRVDVGEPNQATWLTATYNGWTDQTTARGVTGPAMWYTGYDPGGSGSEGCFGILRIDGTEKPAFGALHTWIG